ncbi:MAG: hypothetical protein GY714_04835 [Desulfobacterales bacterium]|nr:hypothetical protein [Desulfobacterales bacterium]MCP4162920.1 hypothetical protein [Deltaproteobacteria bacterium]
MFKKSIVVLLLALLVGCSSKNGSPYNLTEGANLPEVKQYKVGVVNINLVKKYDNEKYPNQKALKELFVSKIKTELTKRAIFSENSKYVLNLDVEYRRIFMGEAFGMKSKFGGSRFKYKSDIKSKELQLGSYESSEFVATHGPFGAFWRAAKMYTGQTGIEEEVEDIEVYVKLVVDQLP